MADTHGIDHDLLFGNETGVILDCSFEVLNAIGHGFNEKTYENALCVEFALRGIPVDQQARFEVTYKSTAVGLFIPDLIAFGRVLIDVKAVTRIGPVEEAQMINYLRVTHARVGLILNFSRPKLEWKRLIL